MKLRNLLYVFETFDILNKFPFDRIYDALGKS